MKYAVIANGKFNNVVWYGKFDDLKTAKDVAEKVNRKVVIWEF